ncbi:hypothetical protein ACS0TY_006192 [Phlomoides rotata]
MDLTDRGRGGVLWRNGRMKRYHERGCVSRLNTDAQQFNKKINLAAAQLQKQYPDLKLVIFDVFKPLYDIVSDPKKNGFIEATRGCCGTGTVETTSLLCNPESIGTCSNSSQYVFWDSVHPSQAANQILADKYVKSLKLKKLNQSSVST